MKRKLLLWLAVAVGAVPVALWFWGVPKMIALLPEPCATPEGWDCGSGSTDMVILMSCLIAFLMTLGAWACAGLWYTRRGRWARSVGSTPTGPTNV